MLGKAKRLNNVVREDDAPYLVDVMSLKQKVQFGFLLLVWFIALTLFWKWWLDSSHFLGPDRFLVNSLVLGWSVLLPGYYFFFLARMKRPNPSLPVLDGLRVAMVVTKAPSEPFEVVKRTLEAMVAQKYPHDTWLADEDPPEETVEWCKKRGVFVSTRRGIREYHRPTWPRRTKCKEGNLAYFYDHYGYDRYDVVVQMDADHTPSPGYLEEMLRPFADPQVGYVSAPSICDGNADISWAARARLYVEAPLHGSLRAGYSGGWAPTCIGSHYAVRTTALKQIGGLGPELAEDFSTTLMMNAHGWKGAHALDAIAHGDGPATFEDFATQEYQWSRSLTTILLTVTPKYWVKLPLKRKAQFLFLQLWYPLYGLMLLTAYLIPIVALLTKTPWVNVSYPSFLLYSSLLGISGFLMLGWVKRNNWLRPRSSKIVTWETLLFHFIRWPWVLLGCIAAIIGVLRRKQFDFRVTRKGAGSAQGVPVKALAPYAFLGVASAVAAIFLGDVGNAQGYYFFAIVNSLVYSIIVIVITGRHLVEASTW